MYKIVVPNLGEGIETAVLAEWYLSKGEQVKSGEDIAEVVTDKASFCIHSEKSGIITEIFAHKGMKVEIGQVIAEISPHNL